MPPSVFVEGAFSVAAAAGGLLSWFLLLQRLPANRAEGGDPEKGEECARGYGYNEPRVILSVSGMKV
ncbi:hypothetical protein [Pajaroellobacter abortibovis]|uniref:Uncharacterized protein n=1 Tax=Pajaroellobacter abortibovis TaxID=1882918 RepID=A0A1L6MVV4_9BACT|nr:hypothetical protein [Pajaroellobacter abortibovis]APR99641.1 hypothetical protein BCY86_02330 [Pajaroellobacter abortibovis]